MNRYNQKMTELGAQYVDSTPTQMNCPAIDADIVSIEHKIGTTLPATYREFLHEFGMFFFPYGAIAPVQEGGENLDDQGNGWISVDTFYSATPNHAFGLLENYMTYHGSEQRMPVELMPIADVGSGSQICLKIFGERQGEVCYWDCYKGSSLTDYSNVYFIANSFDEFVNSLRKVE